MKSQLKRQIEGFKEIENDNVVLRKYASTPFKEQGQVKAVIERYHPSTIKTKLTTIIQETKTTSTLRFVPTKGYLPPFQAGQYVNLFVEVNGIRTSRPYSISSPPNQIGYYDLTFAVLQKGLFRTICWNRFLPEID
jgi:hypothetical protein